MKSVSPRGPRRLVSLSLVASGIAVMAWGTASAAPVTPPPPNAPILSAADCPAGSTLVNFQTAPWTSVTTPDGVYQLGSWTTTPQETGVPMPAGNINITKYWSWHPGPLPTYNEANQQWAIKVGAAVTGFTEDLVGTNTTALTIGALGVFASPGGTISLVHSSTPGGGYPGVYDGSGNSVVPLGFCYQVVPTVESTIASTIAPTTAAPTTASTATTKPGDVTVAPTVAPTTKLPATTQPAPGVLVATPGVTLGANPLSPPTPAPTPAPNPAPTTAAPIATTVPATTVPVTTTPATTLAPTTAAPTVAPATAVIAPEVLGEQIEQTTVAYTGTESRSTAFVGFGLTLTGLSLMLATRKRRA